MTASFSYDLSTEPAAPVLTVRVTPPGGGGAGVILQALVDTGADCTLLPAATAGALRLPVIDEIWIEGVTGRAQRAIVHAAALEFAGLRYVARVAALGKEGILGRDVLNRTVLRLDGPRHVLSVGRPATRG